MLRRVLLTAAIGLLLIATGCQQVDLTYGPVNGPYGRACELVNSSNNGIGIYRDSDGNPWRLSGKTTVSVPGEGQATLRLTDVDREGGWDPAGMGFSGGADSVAFTNPDGDVFTSDAINVAPIDDGGLLLTRFFDGVTYLVAVRLWPAPHACS